MTDNQKMLKEFESELFSEGEIENMKTDILVETKDISFESWLAKLCSRFAFTHNYRVTVLIPAIYRNKKFESKLRSEFEELKEIVAEDED